MARLKDIRKRIASVRNTQKITRAMKMVAAAKLRRAQSRLSQARPYADQMQDLLARIASLMEEPPPLLRPRPEPKKAEFLVITSDRGLCGGFNGNLLRRIEDYLGQLTPRREEVRVHVVGRKGRDFFRSRRRELATAQSGISESFDIAKGEAVADEIIARFEAGEFDEYYLVYNRFKSALSQEVRIDRLLPVEPKAPEGYLPDYLYEPGRDRIISRLVPRAIATAVTLAFLESNAGEQGARMTAMESATNNCRDMISRLTLALNRARQAAITTELMDIVNGAEALKK